MASGSPKVLEPGTSPAGRWLRDRRTRAALWIAVAEGILVAILHDFTRWTVIAIAVPVVLLYVLWGRGARSDALRQVSWIGGASQALAVLFVVLAFLIGFFALAIVAIAAVVAIGFFFVDRR